MLFALFLMFIVGINLIAFMQARAMTHFVVGGQRTAPPESLGMIHKIGVVLTGVRVPRPTNKATPADVGLAYSTVRFGGEGNDDCEGWLVPRDRSNGAPRGMCILFHAYASSKSSLVAHARALHDLGFDLLLVDCHGSGGSRGSTTSIGYTEADDVAAAYRFAVGRDPGARIVLYGQSMGGVAILRAVGILAFNLRA